LSKSGDETDTYIEEKAFAQLIYDHWIFDIAKFIDLAAIYGKQNPEMIRGISSLSNPRSNQKSHEYRKAIY
jgi:hypothetical protein